MTVDDVTAQLKVLTELALKLGDRFMPAIDPGLLDRFRAFKACSASGRLCLSGIAQPDCVRFDELRGIERIIGRLEQNTEQFLRGVPCNNVLLYGPRGTGKSSAVKALLNEHGDRGLRLIEVPRDTLFHLFEIADLLRGRPERFIVFCDDLSFDEDEGSYRQLKAVLEGGLEMKPENVLIYATSNRRHLMPERARDNLPVSGEGELHPSETLEEKMSLSDRFGLRIGFSHFDADTYLDIVSNYAALRKITIDPAVLRERAMQWSLSHGSFSGRTARQFIDDIEGAVRLTGTKSD
jgi:hypothetical protein